MNITAEKKGDYALKINMKFDESDYQDAVKKELNKQRQKAQMPGFRPGCVPMKLVEKMYGKAILVDQVNELLTKQLEKYIEDEKLATLVSPIPSEDSAPIDFDTATSFEFSFDVALAPSISLDFINESKTIQYNITVDPKTIEADVENMQHQFMKLEPTEVAAENDYLHLSYETPELGLKSAYMVIGRDTTKALDEKFIGVKKDDKVEVDVMAAFDNDAEKAAKLLSLKTDDEKSHLNGTFSFTVNDIQKEVLPEMNEDLFSKAFPGKEVKTLDEAKQQFEKRHESVFNEMSDVNLYNNVITYFLENVKIDFSDEILHRYLNLNRENDQQTVLTDEEFKEYRKAYCQDLLLEKLVKEFDIKVDKEDIRHCAAKRIARYFGTDESTENDYFKSIIDNFLKDEKQVKEFYMEALAEKIIIELKSRYKFAQKKVTWEEFQELNKPKVAETTEEAQATTTEGKKEKKASKKANDNQLEMPLD